MGLFSGNNENARRNPDATFGFRALAGGYMLYMLYEMIHMFVTGESDDLVALIVGIVVLGGGGLFILVSSYIRWRREKAEMAAEQEQEVEENDQELAENPEETDENA